MKDIRSAIGAERDAWRLAMQAEVDSLRDSESFYTVPKAEAKQLRHASILPMKLVTGVKHDAATGQTKKKVRAVVGGIFQAKRPNA